MRSDPDNEVAHRADHEQQPERVAYEPRHAYKGPADEHDKPIEQVSSGKLPACKPLLGTDQDPHPDMADDEGPERAHHDQEQQRPQEADLLGHHDERSDLSGDEH